MNLTRYARWSLYAALVTMGLKFSAYLMTDSVSMLSDALESLVNVAGATLAIYVLSVAARPPDEEHTYGHAKAEYFSSGVEGTLIVVAALSIIWEATKRLYFPAPISQIQMGIVISVIASAINLAVAWVILKAGKTHKSITLEANGKHLLTDVWTSLGIVVAMILVWITNWEIIDPILAILLGLHIIATGYHLVKESVDGLMDKALPASECDKIYAVLKEYEVNGIQFHALRTRRSGARNFVSMHVLVNGDWTVHQGHQLLEEIETKIRRVLPNTNVFTHLESLEDAASFDDMYLDRPVPSMF